MNRRNFLLSASLGGLTGVAGCLGATECDEPSNHLYIENQLPNPQEIDVRVFKESDGLLADGEWTAVFLETVEIPGETHRVVEGVYDEYGTYRTAVEHDVLYERNVSEIDDCHGRVVTIGLGDGVISILNGIPEHLATETDSDSKSAPAIP